MSRQSEKFLIGQSRKFLLTAARLKDGTNRDVPTGTGCAGVAEASQRRTHQPAGGRAEDGSERPMGEEVTQADDQARRRGGRAWAAWTALQSQACSGDTATSAGDSEANRIGTTLGLRSRPSTWPGGTRSRWAKRRCCASETNYTFSATVRRKSGPTGKPQARVSSFTERIAPWQLREKTLRRNPAGCVDGAIADTLQRSCRIN